MDILHKMNKELLEDISVIIQRNMCIWINNKYVGDLREYEENYYFNSNRNNDIKKGNIWRKNSPYKDMDTLLWLVNANNLKKGYIFEL